MRKLQIKTVLALSVLMAAATEALFFGFRCHHKNLSQLFHRRNPDNGFVEPVPYKRCLDCGMFREYDFERMSLIGHWRKEEPRKCFRYLEAS
jgi:hypothetical protein